ncbi:DUF2207 domain-containing protein [Altererythrobacter salegens]|uniref:DUF2207 domain-containing protein n=1 Tax=Croceibacterium salegens TaxID=1737568 RepID=A0A6I4SWI4_9SPHN|nr:DUF2207 domain-containing protein [Croceibacterium salegens]MXO58702.1 DUF2207 domain-containing protein [Croceibacterium salegens]
MRLLALLLAALAVLVPGAVSAEERILAWNSDIEVRRDGALDVSETIHVRSEGDQIQHGIFRDFPTIYSKAGRRVRVGFDVKGVTLDGHSEPYSTESVDNGVRIRIGSADTYVDPGEHTYVIDYTTTGQLGFFEGYDELYWNVTGNGWAFPIDSATARVNLPEPVAFGPERAFYTGPQGATGNAARVIAEAPGSITIGTTAPLSYYEGLTIAVRWPKGIVEAPPPPSATALTLERYAPRGAAVIGLLGLLGYFFFAWKRAGRGPRAGTVVPIFSPPDGLSAAAMRYVKKMGYDNRCFAAAVVESGVHRRLRIEEREEGLFNRKKTWLSRAGGSGTLSEPETSMLSELFQGGDSMEMDDENHARFSAAGSALEDGLAQKYEDVTFRRNLSWAWAGLGLLIVTAGLVAAAIAASDTLATSGERAIAAIALALTAGGLLMVFRPGRGKGGLGLGAGLLVLGIICSGLIFFRLAAVEPFSTWGWMLFPFLSLPFVVSAFAWMSAPTVEGRQMMDRIAGFEQYLSITEEERLEAMHPPEKTPELFERYLPYAIALEVENRWADKFTDVLAAAENDPSQRGNTFGWYSGSGNAWSNPSRFAGAMGGALASTISSASTAPGSSSGSGGGGSSGGGGGGGGGGGW